MIHQFKAGAVVPSGVTADDTAKQLLDIEARRGELTAEGVAREVEATCDTHPLRWAFTWDPATGMRKLHVIEARDLIQVVIIKNDSRAIEQPLQAFVTVPDGRDVPRFAASPVLPVAPPRERHDAPHRQPIPHIEDAQGFVRKLLDRPGLPLPGESEEARGIAVRSPLPLRGRDEPVMTQKEQYPSRIVGVPTLADLTVMLPRYPLTRLLEWAAARGMTAAQLLDEYGALHAEQGRAR